MHVSMMRQILFRTDGQGDSRSWIVLDILYTRRANAGQYQMYINTCMGTTKDFYAEKMHDVIILT